MSAASAVPARTVPPERADLAAWLAVAAGTLGAFMALLDVSIVNSALPVIQGEIGATRAEGTWVGTSYLVAEIVIMPLTAWLERVLGLRRLLLIGASGFTFFSVLCGLSTDLTTMILGRIGQGLAGGTLIPAGMTIMAKRLPPRQQSIGMAIFAASALLGPILGPLLGGWITENYSWHYAFFINVPICLGLIVLILAGMPRESGNMSQLVDADWFGVAGITVALGSLTVLLEEGHREQWFESALIWQLAVATVIGAALVTVGQLRAKTPVLKLSLLREASYSANLLLMIVAGGALFAMLFFIPQFLVGVAGYNAYQAGKILAITGVVSIVGSILYPALIARIELKVLVGCAMLITALGGYLASQVTAESGGNHFLISLALAGVGASFSAIPLQQAAVSAVPVEDAGEATSMFNVSRNLGASIFLAALASFLDQRMAFHHWRLHEVIGANDLAPQERLAQYSAAIGGGPAAEDAAIRMLDTMVMGEALVMTFSDIFLAVGLVALVAAPLALLLKPIDPERAQGMMH